MHDFAGYSLELGTTCCVMVCHVHTEHMAKLILFAGTVLHATVGHNDAMHTTHQGPHMIKKTRSTSTDNYNLTTLNTKNYKEMFFNAT